MKLEGRVVVVVGATGGIGRVICQALVEAGAHVVLASRSEERLRALQQRIGKRNALVVPTNAADDKHVTRLFRRAKAWRGHIDAVINTIGTWNQVNIGTPTRKVRESMDTLHDSMSKPGVVVVHKAAQVFKEQGFGVILNMGSQAAHNPKLKGNLTYAFAKGGMLTLLKNLREELRGTKVRMCDLQPMIVNTEENAKLFKTEEERLGAVQPETIARWIVNHLDDKQLPFTKRFRCKTVL